MLKDLLMHLIAHSSAFFADYLIKVDNLTKHYKVEKEKKYMSGSSASKYWLFFETMEELQIQGSCDLRWSIKQRRFNSIGVREWCWAAPGNLIFCGRMYLDILLGPAPPDRDSDQTPETIPKAPIEKG